MKFSYQLNVFFYWLRLAAILQGGMASAWPIVPVSTEAGIVLANLHALQEQREYRVSVAWLLSLK